MKKVLFGCGHYGQKALKEFSDDVECFVDNYRGGDIIHGIPVLDWYEFASKYPRLVNVRIIICTIHYQEIEKQLNEAGFEYEVYWEIEARIPFSQRISFGKWIDVLVELCDSPGKKILEIGSRVVTGANFRNRFKKAEYIGFDYYAGENVDIVGDVHKLSSYFPAEEKFDLIFSSAVFEHLAMPWKAAEEISKLLKVGGYVFVETHYSHSAHERPWHFFQFSDVALKVLFSPAMGIETIEAGVSNPIDGRFTDRANQYLRGVFVGNMFCHSEFLGRKTHDVKEFDWRKVDLDDVVYGTVYPKSKSGE